MTSIVYVIQATSSNRDFSSALRYGKLEFILLAEERVSIVPARSLMTLRSKLRKFTAQDYIVWAGGDPFAPILAGIVLGELNFTEINFLRWEREKTKDGLRGNTGYYIPGKLILRHFKPDESTY